MPKVVLFVCADRAFGAKTVNRQTNARTALHSVLGTQAYRCHSVKEWQDLQPFCRTQRMWSAILIEEDNGALREPTDNDMLLNGALPMAAPEQRIEVVPPISQTSDAGSSDAPGGPVVAAHTSEAETTLANSTEEAQPQEAGAAAELIPSEVESSTPSPATIPEVVNDDRLDRIKAELTKGPSRLSALARDTGISTTEIEELAKLAKAGFVVQAPPSKWCKLV